MGLKGQVVVFTGALSLKRADASARAVAAGATVGSGVTGKTTLGVVGSNAGGKLDDAKGRGIAIWTEAEFMPQLDGKGFCGTADAAAAAAPGFVNVCHGWDKDGWYCGKQGNQDVHYGGFKWDCVQCGQGWMQRGWFCGCEVRTEALVDDQAKVRTKLGVAPVREEVRSAARTRQAVDGGGAAPAPAAATPAVTGDSSPVGAKKDKAKPSVLDIDEEEETPAPAVKKHRSEAAATRVAAPVAVWEYKANLALKDTNGKAWAAYSVTDSATIEAGFQAYESAGAARKRAALNDTYSVDYAQLIQFRSDDEYRQRAIRRRRP